MFVLKAWGKVVRYPQWSQDNGWTMLTNVTTHLGTKWHVITLFKSYSAVKAETAESRCLSPWRHDCMIQMWGYWANQMSANDFQRNYAPICSTMVKCSLNVRGVTGSNPGDVY